MGWNLSSRISQRWLVAGVVLLLTVVVFLAYFPALNSGFWMDDYIALDIAGRVPGVDYFIKYFDPRVQRLWYRPMVGMQWGVEYLLFHAEPIYYHIVQILYHLINSFLLFALIKRVTRRWSVGLVAALLYATFPLSSMSVYWNSVHDPLAIVFYLAGIWFWLDYLESGRRNRFVLTFVAFLGALLTKEIGATLPIILFLADRLLVGKSARLVGLVKRYFVFSIPLMVYAGFEWIVTSRSEFTQQIGYHLGPDTLYVFFKDLSLLAFPWELGEPWNWVWLAGALVLFAVCLLRDRRFAFLAALAILPTLIVSPIPPHLFNPRYLYFPLLTSAVGYALLLVYLAHIIPQPRWAMIGRGLIGAGLVFIVGMGSQAITERSENFSGFIRQIRLQFRPIYQKYPAFPPNTLLYFTDTPLQTLDISGLMFLRYGVNVTVRGVDRGGFDGFQNYDAGYVWYKDDQDSFRDQSIEKNSPVSMSPPPPIQFGNAVVLDSAQVVNSRVKRGEPVIILMRWKPIAPIDRNYTVFAHLVDKRGNSVASFDSQPRNGNAPTTTWRPNVFVVDSVTMPISDDVPPGVSYRLEIGLYDQPTMQRLLLTGEFGEEIGDHLSIEPISVVE